MLAEQYFLKVPYTKNNGPGFSGAQLRESVLSGQVELAAPVYRTAFSHQFAYQVPEVNLWLAERVKNFQLLPVHGLDEIDLDLREWYLWREAEIFGPLSFRNLVNLNQEGAVGPKDFGFMLEKNLRFDLGGIPSELTSGSVRPDYHFNRRERRVLLNCMASLRSVDNSSAEPQVGIALDISLSSICLILKVAPELGKNWWVEIPPTDSLPGFRVEGTSIRVTPFRDGYRSVIHFSKLNAECKSFLRELGLRRKT